jgi:hypothetical protein
MARAGIGVLLALVGAAGCGSGGDAGGGIGGGANDAASEMMQGVGGAAGADDAGALSDAPGAADGGAGGAAEGDAGAGAAGGTGGVSVVDASDAAPEQCPSCKLLATVPWHRNTFFVISGQTLFWKEDYNSAPIDRMSTDGTGRQSFYVADCPSWGGAQVYGGQIYFYGAGNTIQRTPDTVTASTKCQTVFTPSATLQDLRGFFLDGKDNALWLHKYEHDLDQLVRVDLAKFAADTVSSPNGLEIAFADDTSLYGHDNPALGSASYRIIRFDRATKTSNVLQEWVVEPDVIGADAAFVYYLSNDAIYRVAKSTPGSGEKVQPMDGLYRFLRDGSDIVYWKYGDQHVYRVAASGGAIKAIFVGAQVWNAVADDQHYYLMTTGGRDYGPFGLFSVDK